MKLFRFIQIVKEDYIDEASVESGYFLIDLILTWLFGLFVAIAATAVFVITIPLYFINIIYHWYSLIVNIIFKGKENKKLNKLLLKHEKELIARYGNFVLKEKYTSTNNFINTEQGIRQFIQYFLWNYNNSYYTMTKDGQYECDSGRRRSLGDIFLICRAYFPNCTIKEVLGILTDLLVTRQIYGSRCNDIHKYVFHTSSRNTSYEGLAEYGEGYRFKDFMKLFNY